MKLSWLLAFFENSPSVGLLRSRHAPYVIDFLAATFKGHGAVSRGMHELTEALRGYLERLHETEPDVLTDTAENYLADWCSSNKRYLRRFLDADHDEPLYELTSATEDVLTFLDQIARRDKRFVGTESRLKRIIETLSDLALGSSADVAQRIKHLRDQRDTLDEQIAAIEAGGNVTTYHPTAIRERFGDAAADLVQLQGDFRAVEDAFKEITRDVQRRQLTSDATRGEILGEALDAEDGLKGEDQGISFDEFARLILSPSKQEHLETIIGQVAEIEALAGDREGLRRIRDMVPALTAEARKVMRTYQSLSRTLRRLLDWDLRSERQRLARVLSDVRSLAVRLADDPGRGQAMDLSVDHELAIFLPTERPFWSPPTEFDTIELQHHVTQDIDRKTAFTELAMLKSLDWQALQKRVATALLQEPEVTLGQLATTHETYCDAVEVMGLIQIAHEDGHLIDNQVTETISVRHTDGTVAHLDIPRVLFQADRSSLPTEV